MGAVPAHHRRPDETPSEAVDRLPANLRELVHEYGFNVVVHFLNFGVKSPSAIRTLIRAVHVGAREPGNERSPSTKKPGKSVMAHLDAWLVAHGTSFTAQMVIRAIRDGGGTVLPTGGPTLGMVRASEATVTGGNVVCSRQEKHFRRIQAAMVAGDREAWGDL